MKKLIEIKNEIIKFLKHILNKIANFFNFLLNNRLFNFLLIIRRILIFKRKLALFVVFLVAIFSVFISYYTYSEDTQNKNLIFRKGEKK